MEEIIRNIEEAIKNAADMKISLSSDGNAITAVVSPAEYTVRGTQIEIIDIFDQSCTINCEEVEFDEMCDFYIIKSGETEVVVEFKPCF